MSTLRSADVRSAEPHEKCVFGDTVTPHISRMLVTARSILKSEDLAWDAVQIALLRLWRRPRLVEEHGCSLLTHAVKLASLEVHRNERRRHRYEAAVEPATSDATAEDGALREEMERRVRACLDALPEECRRAAELRFEADLDYDAIANRLEVPIGTVRSRLHRARRLMAVELTEEVA